MRQKQCKEAFHALQKLENTLLEDPLLTTLHHKLMDDGDFDAVEKIIQESYDNHYFVDYTRRCPYSPHWQLLLPNDSRRFFVFLFFFVFLILARSWCSWWSSNVY